MPTALGGHECWTYMPTQGRGHGTLINPSSAMKT
jgi:hypothetical protein